MNKLLVAIKQPQIYHNQYVFFIKLVSEFNLLD